MALPTLLMDGVVQELLGELAQDQNQLITLQTPQKGQTLLKLKEI